MSDEIFAAVHARPKRRQGITGQTIDAQMRGTMCQITEWELEELSDEIARLRAEVERLTRKLDGEWNAAIVRAAEIARNACLVPPDGGSPTEAEVSVCDTAYQRILTLIRIRRKATQ